MKEILIATKNKGKVKEFKALFNKFNVKVQSLHDFGDHFPEIEETGKTFKENAQLKAEEIAKLLNQAVIADDSGLVIDSLDGRPGVYSARYAGERATDEENNEKVLQELAGIFEDKRTARFVCVLALATPGEETVFTQGTCEGTIATSPAGENGFGYDPIFIPDGYKITLAQLENEEKNRISHRFYALKSLEDVIMNIKG